MHVDQAMTETRRIDLRRLRPTKREFPVGFRVRVLPCGGLLYSSLDFLGRFAESEDSAKKTSKLRYSHFRHWSKLQSSEAPGSLMAGIPTLVSRYKN